VKDRTREGIADTLAAGTLGALLFLLPFEPRAPAFELLGLRFTLLETAAGMAALVLLACVRRRLPALLRRPALPLVLMAAFAVAHAVSAGLAPEYRAEGARFAARMMAMAGFASIFAASGPQARRAGLLGLLAGGMVVAVLATLEGVGVTALDPLLDAFREMRFNVGGARRATGGTAYPTLAAAWTAAALIVAVALARVCPRPLPAAAAAAALLAPGLLFTYSRGALAAALAGLAVVAFLAWWTGDRAGTAAAGTAAAVTLAFAGAFAARGEVFRLRLGTEGTTAWYGALYAPVDAELRMRPAEERRTEVRVVNGGLKAWSTTEGFALSYHWFEPGRSRLVDGPRTPLPKALAHGEGAVLQALVQAPPEPGCYLLVWDMVQEHTTWFSGQGIAPTVVPAIVGDADARECARVMPPSVRLGGQPGRRELWSAALAMWRDRPWTGVGPDAFRRLYGRYAGRTFWDERVSANNLVLETGATTGLLGVLALTGTLGAAGVAAARQVRASPPAVESAALLGLLAAVLAQGAADYLLAFTGPYLMLAFVVGSSSAAPEPARAAWRTEQKGAA
jgi:O-antigen ligase